MREGSEIREINFMDLWSKLRWRTREAVKIVQYRDAESKTEKISKALHNDKFPCQNVISHLYHDTAV